MPTTTDLGAKTFGMNDQALFAAWSGDHNPMHVDAVAARRLVSGLPVVHGMHTVTEALARWAPHATARPWLLKGEFARPINAGDTVVFQAEAEAAQVRLTASVDGQVHMVLLLDAAPASAAAPDVGLPEGEALPPLHAPLDLPPAGWLGRTAVLPGVQGSLPAAERVAQWLGPAAAAALGQLSTLVGMVCPGLHSVFSTFEMRASPGAGPLRFKALRHEPRFRLMDLAFDGPWQGRVRAFVRQPPQPQPDMATVAQGLAADAYAGRQAWVLGGSRGLGELTAKMVAAGGGAVSLTYAMGRDDAQRVADEINHFGRGQARVAAYVVGTTAPEALCAQLPQPDAVFYFATPRIARTRSGPYDAALLAEFLRCYAEEVAALALALEQRVATAGATGAVNLLNPSSVYVEELPAGMLEYAMAKAASETLALDFNKRLRHVQLHSPRLPRLRTDQTAGLMPSQAGDALAVLRPLVAAMFQPR